MLMLMRFPIKLGITLVIKVRQELLDFSAFCKIKITPKHSRDRHSSASRNPILAALLKANSENQLIAFQRYL